MTDDLLTPETRQNLEKWRESIDHGFRYGQKWRDPVEAACILSPLAQGSTPQARFWQATREQAVFTRELLLLEFDYERKLAERDLIALDVEQIQETIEKKGNGTRIRRRAVAQLRARQADFAQADFVLGEMRDAAKDRVREIEMWSEIKAKAEPDVPDTTCWWAGKEESMREGALANIVSGRDPVGGIRDLVALGDPTVTAWFQRVMSDAQILASVLERHIATADGHKALGAGKGKDGG